MKKTLKTLLMLALAMLFCFVLTSCSDHEHVGEWMTVREPTCVVAGEQKRTCESCGETQTKEISVTGHTPGDAATCTAAQTCTVCNAELTAALGHTAGDAATCTTAQTCTVCNAELTAALGHTAGNAATCTTAQTCTICNAELTAALGHTAGDAATCTTAQTCTICNAELTAALGHHPGGEATCTTAQICTVCNVTLEAEKHIPGEKATCTTSQLCVECGRVLEEATGHQYVIHDLTAEAWKDGSKYYKSCVCGLISSNESDIFEAVAPDKTGIHQDDNGIYCTNLLDFNKETNDLWAKYNETEDKWGGKFDPDDPYCQPMDDEGNPTAPVLIPYSSYGAHKWSLIEDGEVLHFESTDASIYPGIAFSLDQAHDGIMPVGAESSGKAEYVKIRVRNTSACDRMTFGFVTRNTNNGKFILATISELTVDANGKEYSSNDEWVTYTFSMSTINMNTNYTNYEDFKGRWSSNLYEFLIFPFGYDVADGMGNYPGAAIDIDYIVIGSREYVDSYHSALEIAEGK